jgi:hypothetical protein
MEGKRMIILFHMTMKKLNIPFKKDEMLPTYSLCANMNVIDNVKTTMFEVDSQEFHDFIIINCIQVNNSVLKRKIWKESTTILYNNGYLMMNLGRVCTFLKKEKFFSMKKKGPTIKCYCKM